MLGLKGGCPVTATVDIPGYRTIPIHTLPWLSIHTGHDKPASALKRLLEEAGRPARIVIDGFSGVQWETFIGCLRTELTRQGVPARWISTEHCLLPPERVDDLLAPFLTADPVFGRLFRVPLLLQYALGANRGKPRVATARTASHMIRTRLLSTPCNRTRGSACRSDDRWNNLRVRTYR